MCRYVRACLDACVACELRLSLWVWLVFYAVLQAATRVAARRYRLQRVTRGKPRMLHVVCCILGWHWAGRTAPTVVESKNTDFACRSACTVRECNAVAAVSVARRTRTCRFPLRPIRCFPLRPIPT